MEHPDLWDSQQLSSVSHPGRSFIPAQLVTSFRRGDEERPSGILSIGI